jgi:hypothetical protein
MLYKDISPHGVVEKFGCIRVTSTDKRLRFYKLMDDNKTVDILVEYKGKIEHCTMAEFKKWHQTIKEKLEHEKQA